MESILISGDAAVGSLAGPYVFTHHIAFARQTGQRIAEKLVVHYSPGFSVGCARWFAGEPPRSGSERERSTISCWKAVPCQES